MSTQTILTLANGRGLDLLNPKASDVDFDAYAEHLAKEKRFNGATPAAEYSVAEHLCRGTDAVLERTSDRTLAAYFSLHDGHEAVMKDLTTPLKCAIAEFAAERFGVLAPQIAETFKLLEYRHDAAIHEAAQLPWPPRAGIASEVKRFDVLMFVTEWRDLMRGVEHPDWDCYRNMTPLDDVIVPWDWETAKRGLLRRWRELLPAMNGKAAA